MHPNVETMVKVTSREHVSAPTFWPTDVLRRLEVVKGVRHLPLRFLNLSSKAHIS